MLIACGDDDDDDDRGDAAEQQEIADLVTTLASTNGAEATQEEIDFYMAHITDSFVQDFGTESVEACEADAATCIGEPLPNPSVSPDDVEIDGDTARVPVHSDAGNFGIELADEDDTWKANGTYVPDDDIAEGVEVVDIEMVDFAFDFDAESEAVTSGDFALDATNGGEQPHEIILVELPPDTPIDELLMDESFQPEPIFVKAVYNPGEGSDVALPEPLAPGRYGFVCFLPDVEDPEETPHAFLGMASEFTVE
jgi:hypothetical protein